MTDFPVTDVNLKLVGDEEAEVEAEEEVTAFV